MPTLSSKKLYNRVPLEKVRFCHHKITNEKRPLTRKEELNNLIVRLSVTSNYSYSHDRSASYIRNLVCRYYYELLSCHEKYFKRILNLSCESYQQNDWMSIRKTFKPVKQLKTPFVTSLLFWRNDLAQA
ncbi:MAG: hypothetical protein ACRCXZ_03465 [Patescibacteria group bacterium]